MKVGIKTIGAVAATLALSAYVVMAAAETARLAPPNSRAYGKTLTEWLGIWYSLSYPSWVPIQAQVDGVMLMPVPAGEWLGGSGGAADPAVYKGHLQITVKPGTPFVLPLCSWLGERYEPSKGMADDPPIPDAVFLAGLNPTLTIDGKRVITSANQAQFYVPATYWPEPVVQDPPSSYGSIAALFYQGMGYVSPPLAVGKHVIKVYESWIVPPGQYSGFGDAGSGIVYDNTWEITVSPK